MKHQELIAIADCEAEIEETPHFFEHGISHLHSLAMKDEYRLDCYVRKVRDENVGAMTVETMREVLEAARLVYSLHRGRPFYTDYAAAVSPIESPWAHSCATPEDYLIYTARSEVETDEARIEGCEPENVASIVKLMTDLHTAGVGIEYVITRVHVLCHADDPDPESDDQRRVKLVSEAFAEQFAEHEGAAL